MNQRRFLDNLIPDRIRIVQEDKDPIHVYQVLAKNLGDTVENLQGKYEVRMDVVKSQVTIDCNLEDTHSLFSYFDSRGLELESIQSNSLRVDLIKFFNKIY